MTRIGILTFHNTVNYGAVLQAYALQKTIENLGYEVSIIDYRNPAVTARETFSVPKLSKLIVDPRSYFGEMNAYHAFHYRKNKFEHFIDKQMKISPRLAEASSFAKCFDEVVVGSDQIWNLRLTNADFTYFLEDSKCSRLKKVTYAASFGASAIPKKFEKRCQAALDAFDEISVREEAGACIIKKILNRNAEIVLDPTLLVTRNTLERVAADTVETRPYILIYTIAERKKTIEFGKKAAKELNAKIYAIGPSNPLELHGMSPKNDASIEEFLALIRDATLVVTSSFHGLALSLALGTDVCYALSNKQNNANSRLMTLAKLAGIEDRNIENGMPRKRINYANVNIRIEAMREKSMAFLKGAL